MISLFYAHRTEYTTPDLQLQPIACELTQELNGVWQVALEYSTSDDRFMHITENAVLMVPTPESPAQLYRIYNVQKTLTSVIAYALPIFTDAGREAMLLDVRPTGRTGQQALDIMTAGTKYSGRSNITDVSTAYYERKNLLEAIAGDDDNAFIKRWGGEILYNNYEIIINKNAGKDSGMRVAFGFNLQGITEDISTAETVTRIIPVAYNGRTLPGTEPWVDSDKISNYPVIYTKVIEYPEIKLAEDNNGEGYTTLDGLHVALRQAARKDFETGIDLPTINYSCDIVDLAQAEEYASIKNLVKIKLGDIVSCHNKRLNIETKAKAIGITYDCILQRITAVQLGDYRKSYFDRLTQYAGQTAGTTTKNGEVKGETISGFIDLMAAKLKASRGQAEPQAERAILFEDNDQASRTYGAMAIGTTGFMIASEKDNDGEWIWSTFGTGEGFYADAIIAGILYSQNYTEGTQGFKIDLNSGDIYANSLNYYGQELGAFIEKYIDEAAKEGNLYVSAGTPTLNNYPANEWHAPLYPASDLYAPQVWQYSAEYYKEHKGDLAFDAVNGLLYVFKDNDGEWGWEEQPASATNYVMKQLTSLTIESGKIATSVQELGAELTGNYWTIKDTKSAIEQTAESITTTVEANYTTLTETETLRSEVKQNAESIVSKVSKGTISSEISQEAELVKITSDRFSWAATNSSMDLDGKMRVQNIEISGGNIEMASTETSAGITVTIDVNTIKDKVEIYGYGVRAEDLKDKTVAEITPDGFSGVSADGAISMFTNGDSVQTGEHECQALTCQDDAVINGDLMVVGDKMRLIPNTDYGPIGMNAVESLGAFFCDIGSAIITDGSTVVMLDDRMSVTCGSEYYIITTVLEGRIDRIEKHKGYFIAYGEGKFDFVIYAKQKGREGVYGEANYYCNTKYILEPADIAYGKGIITNYEAIYENILAEREDENEEIFNQLRSS